MSLMIRDLFQGMLASISVGKNQTVKDISQYRDFIRDRELEFKQLLELLKNRGEIFAKIHDGCRAGSIVRVDVNQWKISNTSAWQDPGYLACWPINKFVTAKLVNDRPTGKKLNFQIPYDFTTNIAWNARYQAKFDGRKSVSLSYDEHMSLEFLFDYQGPTVYCYSRTERTPEELAAMRDPAQHKVFDQLGDEIQLGDLFLYGGANTLLIGKLIKVTEQGSLAYTAFIGGGSGRISTEMVRRQVKNGENVTCLLKYSKDLGDRLMLFKLSN